jgi:hypothetical protein
VLGACQSRDDVSVPPLHAGSDAAVVAEDAGDSSTPIPTAYPFPCLSARPTTGAANFVSVYLEVFCDQGCTNSYCHGSRGAWAGLDMTSVEGAYQALVGMRTGELDSVDERPNCRASELLRVEPYAPERSLLYLKVSGQAPCGTSMPPPSSGLPELPAEAIDHLRRWIRAGAPLVSPQPAQDAGSDIDAGDELDGGTLDGSAHDAQ